MFGVRLSRKYFGHILFTICNPIINYVWVNVRVKVDTKQIPSDKYKRHKFNKILLMYKHYLHVLAFLILFLNTKGIPLICKLG